GHCDTSGREVRSALPLRKCRSTIIFTSRLLPPAAIVPIMLAFIRWWVTLSLVPEGLGALQYRRAAHGWSGVGQNSPCEHFSSTAGSPLIAVVVDIPANRREGQIGTCAPFRITATLR